MIFFEAVFRSCVYSGQRRMDYNKNGSAERELLGGWEKILVLEQTGP